MAGLGSILITFGGRCLGQTEHFSFAAWHSHLTLLQVFVRVAALVARTLIALDPPPDSFILNLSPENRVPITKKTIIIHSAYKSFHCSWIPFDSNASEAQKPTSCLGYFTWLRSFLSPTSTLASFAPKADVWSIPRKVY